MTEERAVLAGGCFWGVQDLIRRYDGVLSTRGRALCELSPCFPRSRNLFDGPRMRHHQSIRICERGSHVACTTGTPAARST